MRNTEEYVLGMIVERTKKNTEHTNEPNKQRRNLVTDDFDKEYSTMGNKDQPGKVYLSISPDMDRIARWEFKVIVEPFFMPVAADTTAIQPVTLSVAKHGVDEVPKITPNPHTHSINAGVTLVPTDFKDVRIFLDDYDLTAQFKAQFPSWISSNQGMYPDMTVGNRFDIIKALSVIPADKRTSILQQGYHVLEFKVDSLFSFKVREFKRYNGMNRQGDSTNRGN